MNEIKYRRPDELDASIRLISHYDCGTDSTQTRFDVLMGDEKLPLNQYPWGMTSGSPGKSPLHVPDGRGIIGGFDVKVSSEDLVLALRSLANVIEAHKAKAEGPKLVLRSGMTPWLGDVPDGAPIGTKLRIRLPADGESVSESKNDHIWRAIRAAAGG